MEFGFFTEEESLWHEKTEWTGASARAWAKAWADSRADSREEKVSFSSVNRFCCHCVAYPFNKNTNKCK